MQKQKKQKRKRRNRKGENYLIFQFLAEKCIKGTIDDICKAIDTWEQIVISDLRNYASCYHVDSTIRAAIKYFMRNWLAKKLWGLPKWPYEVFECHADVLEYQDINVEDLTRLIANKTNYIILELLRKDRVSRLSWLNVARKNLQKQIHERRHGWGVPFECDRNFVSHCNVEAHAMLNELCRVSGCSTLDELADRIERNDISEVMMKIIREYILDLIRMVESRDAFINYFQSRSESPEY